ncbi:MAG: GMC oxidoreductase [Desulfuromonadales bacterium]
MKKIVVIGSGLAGTLLSNELAAEHDVTLLEKGPNNGILYPVIHHDKKRLAEVHTFCFGEGGTTNLWHNGLIPINPKDVSGLSFKDVLSDALPFIDKAAGALYFANSSFQDEYDRLVAEVNSLSSNFAVFPHGFDCLIYPKIFQKLTPTSGINTFFHVENIEFVIEQDRISRVTFSVQGNDHALAPDIVIVAAGAMGTPGVLQKMINAAGLSCHSAGGGFIDHPMGFVGKVRFKKDISSAFKKLSSYDMGDYVSRNAVRLKSGCGRYTAAAFFRPALTMDNRLDIYKYKSALGASAGLTRLKNAFSWKVFHPDIVAEIFAHLFGVSIPSRTFNILFIAEQKRSGNRVYYDNDQLHVDWSISAEEIGAYREMLNSLAVMLTDLSEEVNLHTEITDDWLWSAAHHSGTTPMGDGDDDLIDSDLKVKFCQNAFVCDGSVLQEHSYANTGLAIGQLAFRLADHIRRKVV